MAGAWPMRAPSMLDLVQEYLVFRRGLGFDPSSQAWQLRAFARHADRVGHNGHMTIDLAVQWATSSSGPKDPAQAARRLSIVRQFARHRAALDPDTEVPPAGLLGRVGGRKAPHIYSDEEIAALLRQARTLLPRRGLRPRTYVAYLSLLASTGLRLSEACRLKPGDVDLADGVITVREGKFRKSRLVPLHPTTTRALARYSAERDASERAPSTGCFFRTDRASELRPDAVHKTFSRLRQRLGWTDRGRARRPRLHDLRHTFAVRRLVRWYQEGVDIDRKMLALSSYLGHARVTDTYWYLSAAPELMAIASRRFARHVQRDQDGAS